MERRTQVGAKRHNNDEEDSTMNNNMGVING
jgi:hypothetical protein